MITGHKDFLSIRQVAEPIDKVKRFLFCTSHSKITRMNNYVGIGQPCDLPMPTVRI